MRVKNIKIFAGIIASMTVSQTLFATDTFNLDEHEKEFFATQTGSNLHAFYPALKPSEAVKAAIDHVVTKHKSFIMKQSHEAGHTYFDFDNKEAAIQTQYNQIIGMLKNEIKYKDSHSIFYHGFSSGMTAYNETLKELMSIAHLKDLGNAHPLHYKTKQQSEVDNVKSFFANNEYYKQHISNVEKLKQQAKEDPANFAKYKNLRPFHEKKNLGVGKAPDSSDYARQNLKCVNLSLFGNSENSGESSYLFYLTSGNIGSFNDFLTVDLLKKAGILTSQSTQEEVDQKISEYKAIYNQSMSQAGGGMLQIMMKNQYVDQLGLASWAKGIPYLLDRETGRLAVRGNDNNKAVPWLSFKNKKYKKPSLLRMIKDYKADPWSFSKKYSGDNKTHFIGIDRFQARLVVNPKVFSNKRKVKVFSTTSKAIGKEAQEEYKTTLHNKLIADLSVAIQNKQFKGEFADRFTLGKVVNYFFGQKVKFSEIIDVFAKSSKKIFLEVFEAVKKTTQSVQNVDKEVSNKFDIFSEVAELYENLKSKGRHIGKRFFDGLKYIFG